MYEIIALLAGVAIGLALRGVSPRRKAAALAAGLGVVTGIGVTALSGELEISPGFLVLDAGQTAAAALMTLAAAWALHRSAPD
jgi:hypothetical protein